MNFFFIFSFVIITSACIFFITSTQHNEIAQKNKFMHQPKTKIESIPSNELGFANQINSATNAGCADGNSDHDYLLENVIEKYDNIIENYEIRVGCNTDNCEKITKEMALDRSGMCVYLPKTCTSDSDCTTGSQNGVCRSASNSRATGTRNGDDRNICYLKQTLTPIPNYSSKYCMAYKPKSDSVGIRQQECMECGYYKFNKNNDKN